MTDSIYTLSSGTTPLVLSLPHVGTQIPDALQPLYVERALRVEDTDWHLEALYAFAKALGASILVPKISRYVIDLNRPPDDAPMYPGAANTELCPTRFFNGEALYRNGSAPAAGEVARRRLTYWQPYHDALKAHLQRVREEHGYALLWDGHSIRSEIPWLFDGRLPDLNLGTAGGTSCAPSLRQALVDSLGSSDAFSHAVDGRFKGGYITRHYGQPQHNVHAVQLEMCQSLYMQEAPPYDYLPKRAATVTPVLEHLLRTLLLWRPL